MSTSSPDHSGAVDTPPVAENYVQIAPGSVAPDCKLGRAC